MSYKPNRREFLKTVITAAAGVQFLGLVSQKAQANPLPGKMNLMLVLTDQERHSMWFPPDWEAANLPNLTRLKANGVSFDRAFCSAAMCTPSRASIFTGLFPSQHHTPWTLTEDYQQTPTEHQLDSALPNLATCLKEAGYDVIYKGKWHLSHGSHGPDGEWIEDDISRYGFDGWDAPDAGGDTRIENFGGGNAAHDARFVDDARAFLEDRIKNPTGRPFCLIVSLVNPHDVLSYPGLLPSDPEGTVPAYKAGGYDDSWLEPTTPEVHLPPTVNEQLLTNYKPTAHANVKLVMAGGLGPLVTPQMQKKYLNFYARLMVEADREVGRLLEVFDENGGAGKAMLDNTLIIRTADHGENGLCHGGLRQKAFVAYEEALRVPLVWSNPVLFPEGRTSDALVSHIDLMPTICSLFRVPGWQSKGFSGVDYSANILDQNASAAQDYILFAYDDIYAASDAANFPDGSVAPPNCLRMIRTPEFKYVRYFDPKGVQPDQEEFYDLRPTGGDYNLLHHLPEEARNLSLWAEKLRKARGEEPIATAQQVVHRTRLKQQLADLETTRLAPRGYAPSTTPDRLRLDVKRWSEDGGGEQAAVQLTFYSCLNTNYQLQRSVDLVSWSNVGAVVPGNGGLIVMSETMTSEKAFYRIQWEPATAA